MSSHYQFSLEINNGPTFGRHPLRSNRLRCTLTEDKMVMEYRASTLLLNEDQVRMMSRCFKRAVEKLDERKKP